MRQALGLPPSVSTQLKINRSSARVARAECSGVFAMKNYLPLSLIASAVVLCFAATSGQAAVPGARSAVPSASHHLSLISKTGWHRHRRCWWRHHHRHCRY